MGSHAYRCIISLSHGRGAAPFYVCNTQVIDRRSLRSLLRKFCSIHSAEYGCIVCDEIVWCCIAGFLYRG